MKLYNKYGIKHAYRKLCLLKRKEVLIVLEHISEIDKPVNVTELQVLIGIKTHSEVSQRLKILRDCGLVIADHKYPFVYYSLDKTKYLKLINALKILK